MSQLELRPQVSSFLCAVLVLSSDSRLAFYACRTQYTYPAAAPPSSKLRAIFSCGPHFCRRARGLTAHVWSPVFLRAFFAHFSQGGSHSAYVWRMRCEIYFAS
jgi:hypothetical protein